MRESFVAVSRYQQSEAILSGQGDPFGAGGLGEPFVAIDDDQGGFVERSQLGWRLRPSAVVLFRRDEPPSPPIFAERGKERSQERGFSRAMRSDDLPPPGVFS